MKLNLKLVRVLQFLQQFKLDICYKSEKEHIIPDASNDLANANSSPMDIRHSELDVLFIYNTTLIEIYPILVS